MLMISSVDIISENTNEVEIFRRFMVFASIDDFTGKRLSDNI
jgi:hypothetical protein